MKSKDKAILASETISSLSQKLTKAQTELVSNKLDLKMQKLTDTSQIKKLKNQIAILKTIIHQKQTNSAKGSK